MSSCAGLTNTLFSIPSVSEGVDRMLGCGRNCPERALTHWVHSEWTSVACDRHATYRAAVAWLIDSRVCPEHADSIDPDVEARVSAAIAGSFGALAVWCQGRIADIHRTVATLFTSRPERWVRTELGRRIALDDIDARLVVALSDRLANADPRASYRPDSPVRVRLNTRQTGVGWSASGRAEPVIGFADPWAEVDGVSGSIVTDRVVEIPPGSVTAGLAQLMVARLAATGVDVTIAEAAARLQGLFGRLAILDPGRALAVHHARVHAEAQPWIPQFELRRDDKGKVGSVSTSLQYTQAESAVLGAMADRLLEMAAGQLDAQPLDLRPTLREFRVALRRTRWDAEGEASELLTQLALVIQLRRTAGGR